MAANLTTVAIQTRKVVRYGIYSFIIFMLIRAAFLTSIRLYQTYFPKKEAPATVGFGKLPEIAFPPETEQLPTMEYTLETPTGALPEFVDKINVYFMPKSATTLASADTAKRKARAVEFSGEPIEFSPTVYRFIHPKFPSTLDINIASGVFSLTYNLASDQSPINNPPPTPEEAKKEALNFLGRMSSIPSDLNGPVTQTFLRVEEQKLTDALALSDANFVKVNLFREAFKETINKKEVEYPHLTADSKEANVWFIISGDSEESKKYIGAEFKYYPIDKERFETYPIKTAAAAFEDLKAGKGFVANLGLNKEGKVIIRKVYLAYYDPNVVSEFYQPIIVFEGDRGFVAYVPAVTPEYYGAE
jgi:hypothetical protein